MKINFARFLLGLVGVSVPLIFLQEGGHPHEAWLYTMFILLILLLVYQDGIIAGVNAISGLVPPVQ
jgi:hypothetical protein